MRKEIYLLLFVVAIVLGCKKEECLSFPNEGVSAIDTYSKQDAYKDFAVIFSKAIAEEQSLRDFIKTEALEMYDFDYDVFFPWVKEEFIDGSRSFENILSYYDEDGKLQKILNTLPKLTIMVPDWSWIGAFGIEDWDISDSEVLVGTAGDEIGHDLYFKGEKVLHLNNCEYLSCPVLIVKENERMTVSAQTKAGEPVFDFAYPEFNNTVSTKGREWGYQTVNLYPEILTDFVPLSDIDAGLVSSVEKWREENLPNACQRDYFCYGMSKDNPDSGSFNNSIREQLYRFRLSPSLYYTIADQDGDPTLSEMKEFVGKNNVPTWQQLKEMAWSDGAYEFNFQFYSGKENTAGTLMASPHFTVFGKNAFELTQVQEKYLHQTWFQKGIYQYSFEPEDLISKWIYPEEKYYLPEWDISSCSNNLFITIYEVDGDEKISLTKSVTYSYSHNFKNSFSAEYTGKKFKISFGTSSETTEQKTESSTITTEYTKGSDDLGLGKLEYTQKILNQPDNDNDTDGYSAVSVNIAGSVIVTLLPCNISM